MIPIIRTLVQDPESIIRQHVAAQLLPIALTCCGIPQDKEQQHDDPAIKINEKGVRVVTEQVFCYLEMLLSDQDLDVRRAAADSLSQLAIRVPEPALSAACEIPNRLVDQHPPPKDKKKTPTSQHNEDVRMTACHLLAEMGGTAAELLTHQKRMLMEEDTTVLQLALRLVEDPSVRVRRSAAQALPRLLGACRGVKEEDDDRNMELITEHILPAFESLSQDEIYRVRKSTGECLVDMSRSMMMIPNKQMKQLRRETLLPIAERLIQDSHKMVRQGMMQFLGPFMASFYPFQEHESQLKHWLPTTSESDGSHHLGIVAQFFPHATSMVSRLNSSQNAVTTAPTPVRLLDNMKYGPDRLTKELPKFVRSQQVAQLSLNAVVKHRQSHPPDPEDLEALMDRLLDYFAALAIVSTGDENTDAEMRVYCAYSFPAVVLLLGPENWEGSLQTCFQTLLNPALAQNEDTEEEIEPPMPVKRCLASSLHTIAHILGPEITSHDIVPVVLNYFLHDPDESVRLNIIRNFPSLVQLVSPHERREVVTAWGETVRGDEVLGARKRSAHNPLVLNWRQRDYLGRSLVDLIGLLDQELLREQVWPILQMLLTDNICEVREDALWAIPILLRAYCSDNVWSHIEDGKSICKKGCKEVFKWIKQNILKLDTGDDRNKKMASFDDRQAYCRICMGLALSLRFNEDKVQEKVSEDPVSVLGEKFKTLFFGSNDSGEEDEYGPYERLHRAEEKHIKKLLVEDYLPLALEMKEDRISNVRVALLRMLQVLPRDIRKSDSVKPVLKQLEEEVETWESFGGEDENMERNNSKSPQNSPRRSPRKSPKKKKKSKEKERSGRKSKRSDDEEEGPVDLDETQEELPSVSLEEEATSSDDAGADNSDEASLGDQGSDAETLQTEAATDGDQIHSSDARPVLMESSMTGDIPMAESSDSDDDDHQMGEMVVTVTFDDGPIGMQLEPTAYERACRVYGFLDAGPNNPSPARVSGKISMGDVIVAVNGQECTSYDATISLLKAGGRREVTFRPGTEDDDFEEGEYGSQEEDGGGGDSGEGEDDGPFEDEGGSKDSGDLVDKDSKKVAKKEAKKAAKKEAKKAAKKKEKKRDKSLDSAETSSDNEEDVAHKKKKKDKKKKKE